MGVKEMAVNVPGLLVGLLVAIVGLLILARLCLSGYPIVPLLTKLEANDALTLQQIADRLEVRNSKQLEDRVMRLVRQGHLRTWSEHRRGRLDPVTLYALTDECRSNMGDFFGRRH